MFDDHPLPFKVDYRPGYTFRIRSMWITGEMFLEINAPVSCAIARDGRVIQLATRRSITSDFLQDRELLKRLVRQLCIELEMHEADEWLLIDGVREFDPHKKVA